MGRNSSTLLDRVACGDLFLTEGAVVERMRREFRLESNEHLVFGGAIYDPSQREILAGIYGGYLETARRYDFPILLTSSTRRSNRERVDASMFAGRAVNQDWIQFLGGVRSEHSGYEDNIFIGGLLGTKGDAYDPREALSEGAAYDFHSWQCGAFQESDADFLMAGVVPSVSEAKGLARSMGETGLPFIISFVVNPEGRLLDGTLLGEAMAAVDEVSAPCCFMVNCVHPANLLAGLALQENQRHPSIGRLVGIQANASRLSPAELNNSPELRCDGAEALAASMLELFHRHHFRIFGGCCGTDGSHMEQMAAMLRQAKPGVRAVP